jgi:hypothetical protein
MVLLGRKSAGQSNILSAGGKMGFFSWRCAKTGLPSWPMSDGQAVLVAKDGAYRGTYDGYGNLAGFDLADHEEVKVVIARHYAGEAFDQLKPSGMRTIRAASGTATACTISSPAVKAK